MTRPRGILDLLRSELEVGIAFSVQRWYDESALANGELDREEFGGRTMSGGGR